MQGRGWTKMGDASTAQFTPELKANMHVLLTSVLLLSSFGLMELVTNVHLTRDCNPIGVRVQQMAATGDRKS